MALQSLACCRSKFTKVCICTSLNRLRISFTKCAVISTIKEMKQRNEFGMAHPLLVTSIVLGVCAVGFAAFSIWAFLNYQDQKNNVDAKIAAAVADAKRVQSEEEQAKFVEQEKEPLRKIVGPDDLGQVT